MLKPFAEAVAFVRERKPQPAEVYYQLSNDARLRAVTVAGLAKMAALQEVADLGLRMTSEGLTMTEVNEELANIIEANGGTLLPPARLDLIVRNMNALAASAGRYRQIVSEGIADERPFAQFPLGPSDSKTTAVCRRLQGLVFRINSPLGRRIWPPLHHNERHISPTTMTEEQALASGRLYQGSDDDEYPFLEDPETGQASRVMPDPGFDFDPGSLLAADGGYLAGAAENLSGEVARKTAVDYGLPLLSEVPSRELPEQPSQGRNRGAAPRKESAAWFAFRSALGFRGEEATTILADFAGEGVIATRESFEQIMGIRGEGGSPDAAGFFGLLRPTIEEPFEAWLLPHVTEGGVKFVRRYIGLFTRGRDRRVAVVIDRSPEGWLMHARFYGTNELPEAERRGILTTSPYKKKTKGH
jgi:hypothetical protein